jgi:cyclopropane fatty-acyl-phospholipid synthase-like methyltransferase
MHHETIQYYDQNAEKLTNRYLQADMTVLYKILKQWIPSDGRILEIGCGCGRDAVFMAKYTDKIIATDASQEMLRQADQVIRDHKMSHRVKLIEAAFPLKPDHPLLKERFDGIVCLAMIMHVPDNEFFNFGNQIHMMLKKGRVFICSLSSGERSRNKDKRLYIDRKPEEIVQYFKRHGLHLLRTEEAPDGLGRALKWDTLIFCSENQ